VNKTPPYPHALESLIEQYLQEKMGSGLISVSESARLYSHLMEGVFPIHHWGFVRFLKNRGIPHPKYGDLSELWISEYHEFLLQNFGELTQQAAMECLRALWLWARENDFIRKTKEPDVFYYDKASPRFRIQLKITELPAPTRHRS
jgi:hypothetical protein